MCVVIYIVNYIYPSLTPNMCPCYKTAPPVGCMLHNLAHTISRHTISALYTSSVPLMTFALLCVVLFKALSLQA